MPYTNPYTKHIPYLLVKYTKPICKVHDSNFLYNLFAAKIKSFFDFTKFFTEQKRTFKSLYDSTKSMKIRLLSLISRNFWRTKKEAEVTKHSLIWRDFCRTKKCWSFKAFFDLTYFLQNKKPMQSHSLISRNFCNTKKDPENSNWFHEIFCGTLKTKTEWHQ